MKRLLNVLLFRNVQSRSVGYALLGMWFWFNVAFTLLYLIAKLNK